MSGGDRDSEVEEAGQVFLLMKKEYRISRNVRLAWFLNRLNQNIRPMSKSELSNSSNELDVLSVLPKGWQPDESIANQIYQLVPSTHITFFAQRYRFVIELDLSPSTGIVDDSTGELIFDEVFHALSKCLVELLRPFKVPGTDIVFQPEIYITILAYSSIIGLQSHQVLVQGCLLDRSSLDTFLQHIYQQLRAFENNVAEVLQQYYKPKMQSDRPILSQGDANDFYDQSSRKMTFSMVTPDMGLVNMIRNGILALQLLPFNSCAGIIIITDGVTSVPDVAVCETLLNQLRGGTIACSFIQVGGVYSYDCSFGYVPNLELMKFIAMATFGSYMSTCPESSLNMNAYHKAFLLYSFLRPGESMNPEYYCVSQHKLFNEHLVSASSNPALAMRRKKHAENEVHADLTSVVSVRLREGYTVKELNITKGGTQLEVKLMLLWKHNMRIEYLVVASWPLDAAKRLTWVEVTMEGSYDMLHDISCTMRKPITSPYRTTVIRRFWNTLQSINQTDQMLVHLKSFNTIPEHYTIPESTKNGVPLFYIPPGSTTPVLSLQHSGSKDSSQSQFSSYWKPILSMDASFWQRWLHMHRIGILLEHDIPVPKHIHTPGSNGRYSTIQCRISLSALTSLLRDWSSFVLVEGYSYVKLHYNGTDQPPSSFYLVRVISKAPCMVLRLGFPIGMQAQARNKIVDELRDQILSLRFPQRVQSKEATPKVKRKHVGNASPSKSPPLPATQLALSDRPCVVILKKPLEKLLIRYEKLPSDYRTPFILNLDSCGHPASMSGATTMTTTRTASSTLASLSRYFYHQRWIWSVQPGLGPSVPITSAAQILSILTEIRLSEGFRFAATGDGIVTMVIELPMKDSSRCDADNDVLHTCLVQYIIFPPHTTSTKDSFSTDDDNDTEVEAIELDTELNLVTECWVEPQSGHVVTSADSRKYLNGLSYLDIPKAIFPQDYACVSSMLTFEHLSQLCQNKDYILPLWGSRNTEAGDYEVENDFIRAVPFQFDLMKLLSKCQQIELFFHMFTKAENDESTKETTSLPNEILLNLFHSYLQQDLSDRELPLADSDHITFMQQIVQRDRNGHPMPFSLPQTPDEPLKVTKMLDRQDTMMSLHNLGSNNKEVLGSTSTLQSVGNPEMTEDNTLPAPEKSTPQWKCYARFVNAQQILLIFLPATFADVQRLIAPGIDESTKHSRLEDELLQVEMKESMLSEHPGVFSAPSTIKRSESGIVEETLDSKASQVAVSASKINSKKDFVTTLHSPGQETHSARSTPLLSPTLAGGNEISLTESEKEKIQPDTDSDNVTSEVEKERVEFSLPPKKDCHITFSRQTSQIDLCDPNHLRCPVYIYNCSLESLREQLVNSCAERSKKDIYFRSQDNVSWELYQDLKTRSLSQERSANSSSVDPQSYLHKNKELTNYCNLIQEHYHQCYVKGVFRSLQQSYYISSQDLLTAMDYCEELLQEVDITTFLQTLCGHIRSFRESHDLQRWSDHDSNPTTFVIGGVEPEDERVQRGVLASTSSIETEDLSEQDLKSVQSSVASPVTHEEPKAKKICLEFPLSFLQSSQHCEVYPNLHKIIQDKFLEIGRQHFKTVPSNPYYFFYCPPSAKREEEAYQDERDRKQSEENDLSELEIAGEEGNISGCGVVTESDPDLEVEYRERSDKEVQDAESLSDTNTVNRDDDSFSVLGGDSLNEQDISDQEMPPLFVHLTCSIGGKKRHGPFSVESIPVESLPTCLGEIISCPESFPVKSIDLNDLVVTLDIFVLTLPLEIEIMPTHVNHHRYTSESSSSMNRSPGQPSSYRSDDEIMQNIDRLVSTTDERITEALCDPLSKLPVLHKQAVLATMDEIHWLLEDEIVSALRHSTNITLATLQKVADHVYISKGRPRCHSKVVPLKFVFGPEESLEKFKEEFKRMNLPGYLLNEEANNFYYLSVSRLHAQRIEAAQKCSTDLAQHSLASECVAVACDESADAEVALICHQQQENWTEPMEVTTVSILPEGEKSEEKSQVLKNENKPTSERTVIPAVTNGAYLSSTELVEESMEGKSCLSISQSDQQDQVFTVIKPDRSLTSTPLQQSSPGPERVPVANPPSQASSAVSLVESVQSNIPGSTGFCKLRPSRVQSVVSSQGSLDSDLLGYDGGSSDSECEGATMNEQDPKCPLMPDFWLIIRIHHDRVEVYCHTRNLIGIKDESEVEEEEELEYLRLYRIVIEKITEICRMVNQRLLLQDLHDSHVCNSLLVAESEEDIWKNETPYPSYRPRVTASDDYSADDNYQSKDYLAATMHFMAGHFSCEVVWKTIIHIHPRLKMGPNMGVARAIQALRSVLNAFSVVNRKNMFVYQERATKSVFYLRLSETTCSGNSPDWDRESQPPLSSRSLALTRSQEPILVDELGSSRPFVDSTPSRSAESSRPVGQVDKHILLMVHGVGQAGPEITDELVKVLRRRLDEATLDIITVMLVRNCKLTPADVEFIQPPGTPPTEVVQFTISNCCLPWLHAVASYLRQNLLIFLHTPKYTDSNVEHHFQHYTHGKNVSDADIYLYNKPGGQGTGGKGIACIALSIVDQHGNPILTTQQQEHTDPSRLCFPTDLIQEADFNKLTCVSRYESNSEGKISDPNTLVRFDIWEQGNISLLQLTEKLQNGLRHALCDVVMEFRMLQCPLCVESYCPAMVTPESDTNGRLSRSGSEIKEAIALSSSLAGSKSSPVPVSISTPGNSESTTPTSKTGRRSFWDMLSKTDFSDTGTPKTTDDIVLERTDDSRIRRRHKTEHLKQSSSHDRTSTVELEQTQRQAASRRKRTGQLEEGDLGSLHPLFHVTCQQWMAFMGVLGCPSVQQCSVDIGSRFLLSSILTEIVNLISSLATDTTVKIFEKISSPHGSTFLPYSLSQHSSTRPGSARQFILIGRNFHQWRYSTEQVDCDGDENRPLVNSVKPHKGFQKFEAVEFNTAEKSGDSSSPGLSGKSMIPRQRFLIIDIIDKKLTLYTYNWSVDLGVSLNRGLIRLIQWQNARSHVVHCLLSQKMGLFHHYCFADTPVYDDSKQEPNPFLQSTLEADALIKSPTPPPSKEQGRLSSTNRSLPVLHFPPEIVPFDEALRDVTVPKVMRQLHDVGLNDPVSRHGTQFLEIKNLERKEMEKQMKIENLFVTWQQRSAQSNMPITLGDLDTLKQSSRLVHYCATPLLFDPVFRQQIQAEQQIGSEGKKRHRSNDSTASGRDRSHSCDSVETMPFKLKEEQWLGEISNAFMQQYIQYLQSMGFILVQVRPPSPMRSLGRTRPLDSRPVSIHKQKSDDSPKSTDGSCVMIYHLQRALPGGIVLMELAFQGCYFCVKQYALECSRIPMGQSVNSQGSLVSKARIKCLAEVSSVSESALSMLFTEECDKVRDLMHVHSFSYDFHLRIIHQYLVGRQMTLRQGYHLTSFLEDFICHHPDIPKYGRNHIFEGTIALSTNMTTAHQLYNYITDHASIYGMKPLRMSRTAMGMEGRKGTQNTEMHEYALVALWNRSGSYKDSEGIRHHDEFDVSLLVCHSAGPFEELPETERNMLRLRFYVIMTSCRELFPRLTADMRRFKKLPHTRKDSFDFTRDSSLSEKYEPEQRETDPDGWDETSDSSEFYLHRKPSKMAPELFYSSPLFPLLASEVATAQEQITMMVQQAKSHCRRDVLWQRLFLGEHLSSDKHKMSKLSFAELEELLGAVHSKSISEIDPQLDCFLSMSTSWYQSLIKVLLNRFSQSCRLFVDSDRGTQYLAVLNQKFIDCFVLIFLDSQSAKTNLKVVFREPLPAQPQNSDSPLPQLVSMYYHLESVINTACFNLWTGMLQ
ncbi:KICSTOR complex protein SZT2 [Hemiscyllium ocellatum]|uniref:KICSTOR complex protein SZT2 n=1 Tax=Hemiscyllium ocellatum TaxID=170820 RepID=UPI002966EE38|nr:KICSTOR complex protein SZT2 [Hemiscyllium ocellatum]